MNNVIKLAGLVFIILSFILHSCKKDEVPTLTTAPVTNITGTSATSGGAITSKGSGTIVEQGICWSIDKIPTILDSRTTESGGNGSFISNMSNLEAITIYNVRAYATNAAGTGYGKVITFTTLGHVPSATTQAATNVTATSATLNGVVNANYLSTEVTFEYGTTTNYGQTITAAQSPVSGSSNINVTAEISGLIETTIYHFRIKTVNDLGTSDGNNMSLTTLGHVPSATTKAANNITATSATLNGVVNANSLSTTVIFEYGTTTTYGQTITAAQSAVNGNSNIDVSAEINGLTEATIYNFRVKAVNDFGTALGNNFLLITLGKAPTILAQSACCMTSSAVTLNGIVNANYISTYVTFEYGPTIAYGSSVEAVPGLITGNISTSVGADIAGLNAGTTYHYRIKAINSLGTTYSDDMSFATLLISSAGSIDFVFQPNNDLSQVALWVEDANGKYIATIFLTNFIGRSGGGNHTSDPNIDITGGNRLSALPVWSFKRGVIDRTFGIDNYYPPAGTQPSYPNDIDAISGATPDKSIQKITWQLPNLPYGIYNCWIEVNRSYDFNMFHNYSYYRGQPSVVWNTTINVTENPDSNEVLTYKGYGSPDGSDGDINPPDSTITTATDLLDDLGGYKFRVIYTPK